MRHERHSSNQNVDKINLQTNIKSGHPDWFSCYMLLNDSFAISININTSVTYKYVAECDIKQLSPSLVTLKIPIFCSSSSSSSTSFISYFSMTLKVSR